MGRPGKGNGSYPGRYVASGGSGDGDCGGSSFTQRNSMWEDQGKMTTLWIAVGVVVMMGASYLFLRWRAGQGGGQDDTVYHFKCPSCKRRLRFYGRQVGHKGICPHCRHAVVFPSKDQAID